MSHRNDFRSDGEKGDARSLIRTGPLVKWPGGKRWLAPWLADLIRDNLTGTYLEPFAGGASLFFYLEPLKAVLSDINFELIETYRTVRDSPEGVRRTVQTMPVSAQQYYLLRASSPQNRVHRAARFLYLNRTAFGGIFRLNRKGEFNVPYGGGDRTPEAICRLGVLKGIADLLDRAEIRCEDFETVMGRASSGDVIYCDPAYTVAHNNNGFIRYNERNFSWGDQKRLARAARRAQRRGAFVVVSNAYHPELRRLYGSAEAYVAKRPSLVASRPEFRRTTAEYIFVLEPDDS